jgi:hypothetical protein
METCVPFRLDAQTFGDPPPVLCAFFAQCPGFGQTIIESSVKFGCGVARGLASVIRRFTSPWGDIRFHSDPGLQRSGPAVRCKKHLAAGVPETCGGKPAMQPASRRHAERQAGPVRRYAMSFQGSSGFGPSAASPDVAKSVCTVTDPVVSRRATILPGLNC